MSAAENAVRLYRAAMAADIRKFAEDMGFWVCVAEDQGDDSLENDLIALIDHAETLADEIHEITEGDSQSIM